MTDRYTKGLLSVIAVVSTLLLTSCSNPDTSGGVTLSKGADDANELPDGDCDGPGKNTPDYYSGCGWIHVNDHSFYIMPKANLRDAYLMHADLYIANLFRADLSGAVLSYAFLGEAILTGANLTDAHLYDADLTNAYLTDADLSGAIMLFADLSGAVLSGADLRRAKANSSTICPNGKKWGTPGNNCGF